MKDEAFYTLAYTLIVILSSLLVYCGYSLKRELKLRSEERTEARRAYFRTKAYKKLAYKQGLKKRRETLWNTIKK